MAGYFVFNIAFLVAFTVKSLSMSDTKPIRKGEELDKEKLADYLSKNLSEAHGEIDISQFPAGASNLTYCIKIDDNEYVLRRPPFGNKVKSAHDMSREFNVLSKLSKSINLHQDRLFIATMKM